MNTNLEKINTVYYKSSQKMSELSDNSVDLIITSPPYFTIRDYSKSGGMRKEIKANGYIVYKKKLVKNITERKSEDVGNIHDYQEYLTQLTKIWKECERVLKPRGKLCINAPFYNSVNGLSYNLSFDIHRKIIDNTQLLYYDKFIWDKPNRITMFFNHSFPYPGNIHSWILKSEDIIIFTKGKVINDKRICEKSKLSKEEWREWRKTIWSIPTIRLKGISHTAPFPPEIAKRLIRLYSFVNDLVLDPFAGSGTTLLMAQQLGRQWVGYELYEHYAPVINSRMKTYE